MTNSKKLAIRISEIRQRLNEIAGLEGDALTEEVRAEADKLQADFKDVETQWRSATIAEGEEIETRKGEVVDGEERERLELRGKVSLGGYLVHAGAGSALDGAEAEYNAAVGVEARQGGCAIPWDALEVETRADAATGTSALAGGDVRRPILSRLFGAGIMGALGVRIDSVPAGISEWPLITGGDTPAQTAENAAHDAAAATFSTASLKPKRLTGRYLFSIEQAAQVPDLESSLRRDLGAAVMAKMSDQTLNGDGTAPNVTGLFSRIAEPTAPTAVATYSDYAGLHAAAVDGLHADMETSVSGVIGPDTYRHAAGVYQAGSGESGSEALKRRSASCMASPFIAAPAAKIQQAILHAGTETMRGDSVAAMWPALEVIRDIYTKASSGQISLTWVALWDLYAAFRMAAYKRASFKLA